MGTKKKSNRIRGNITSRDWKGGHEIVVRARVADIEALRGAAGVAAGQVQLSGDALERAAAPEGLKLHGEFHGKMTHLAIKRCGRLAHRGQHHTRHNRKQNNRCHVFFCVITRVADHASVRLTLRS